MESYRNRRRKPGRHPAQSDLPFGRAEKSPGVSVQEQEPPDSTLPPPAETEFSFTIAIGRCAGQKTVEASQFLIDVSAPTAVPETQSAEANPDPVQQSGLYPVASIEDRRLAALVDTACLVFAWGSFLALFGSLGGQFAFSKLNAAVYSIAFAIVYVQYFCLFTVFGGTTPGMMLRGLRVVDFAGETPSPRQLSLRAAGYLLSAGTFFLGFLWSMWDEDALTWHDRLSHTYLSREEPAIDAEIHDAAASR